MSERNRVTRAPEDILIAILTQTESQLNGLSTVQITIDHKSPDLQNIALESTRNLFIQQSADTYKASQINISIFINILIGVKANGWTLMGTNAFLNNAKQEVVKTFYFEKIGAGKSATAAKLNNSTSSSSPSVRSPLPAPVAIPVENGRHLPAANGASVPVRGTPDCSPRDVQKTTLKETTPATNRRQATEEQKDSRVNGIAIVGSVPARRNAPPDSDVSIQANQKEVMNQREKEATNQREAAAASQREAANQREISSQKEAAAQREAAIQREAASQREAAAQREAASLKEAAIQRELAIQKEAANQREVANQRERDVANQKERELLANQRDVANQREREAANQRESELLNRRESSRMLVPETSQRSSPPPPPIDTKSPNNSGPGAIDFNKFPARLRPSPTAKGDKTSSTAPSDIQKKNAEYFKRMKKVTSSNKLLFVKLNKTDREKR